MDVWKFEGGELIILIDGLGMRLGSVGEGRGGGSNFCSGNVGQYTEERTRGWRHHFSGISGDHIKLWGNQGANNLNKEKIMEKINYEGTKEP